MANISDSIEQFILSVIGEDSSVKLSRNELASYFSVSPSQINYVLSTRFGVDRGYIIESRRGGGGFVTVVRLTQPAYDLLSSLVQRIDLMDNLTWAKSQEILHRLRLDNLITVSEEELLKCALSDRALASVTISSSIRKNIMKEILIGIMRRVQE